MTIDQSLLDEFMPGNLLRVSRQCLGFQYKPDSWQIGSTDRESFTIKPNDLMSLCKPPLIDSKFSFLVFPVLHPVYGKITLNFNPGNAMNYLGVVSVEEDE